MPMADTADVMLLIRNLPLCASCIALKLASTEVQVIELIRKIEAQIVVVDAQRPCDECNKIRHTYTVRAHA